MSGNIEVFNCGCEWRYSYFFQYCEPHQAIAHAQRDNLYKIVTEANKAEDE